MLSTYYWLGDAPAVPLVFVPTRDGEPIDLALYATAAGIVAWPDGTTSTADVAIADQAPEGQPADLELQVTLPAMLQAGMAWLRITLQTAAGRSDRLDALPIIVQSDDGWHSLPSARAEWPAAGKLTDRRLWTLLEVAKGEVLAYAPALPDGALPPVHYREAQLMHTRNRLNAAQVDAGGQSGSDSFQLTPFPLDWQIKQLLRPQRGLKAVR